MFECPHCNGSTPYVQWSADADDEISIRVSLHPFDGSRIICCHACKKNFYFRHYYSEFFQQKLDVEKVSEKVNTILSILQKSPDD